MKRTKRILVTLFCAVLLVTGTVAVTVAYLTSTDTVTNTFTVGNVKITLDEFDCDEDENSSDNVEVDGEKRDKANTYKILPGQTYRKDPIIRVSNDENVENCYLFVKVVDGIAAIQADTTVTNQMLEKGWKRLDDVANVWYWTGSPESTVTAPAEVEKGSAVPVFDNFKIADNVDNTTLATYQGKTITVNAYAIQVAGFKNSEPAAIWSAAQFE